MYRFHKYCLRPANPRQGVCIGLSDTVWILQRPRLYLHPTKAHYILYRFVNRSFLPAIVSKGVYRVPNCCLHPAETRIGMYGFQKHCLVPLAMHVHSFVSPTNAWQGICVSLSDAVCIPQRLSIYSIYCIGLSSVDFFQKCLQRSI